MEEEGTGLPCYWTYHSKDGVMNRYKRMYRIYKVVKPVDACLKTVIPKERNDYTKKLIAYHLCFSFIQI